MMMCLPFFHHHDVVQNPKVLQETINGVDGKIIQPKSSRARRREVREPMATEACAPSARKSEERAVMLAEYIFER